MIPLPSICVCGEAMTPPHGFTFGEGERPDFIVCPSARPDTLYFVNREHVLWAAHPEAVQ